MGFKGLKVRVKSFEYTSTMHYQNGNLQITSKLRKKKRHNEQAAIILAFKMNLIVHKY